MEKEDIKVMNVVMKSVILPASAWLMIARACELTGQDINRASHKVSGVMGEDVWNKMNSVENEYYEIAHEISKQVNR